MNGMERTDGSDTASSKPKRPRVLLIAGWGRSGSTILANVLDSAPGVTTLGEINNIWERGFGDNLLCSCGEPFSRCAFWRPVAEKAFGADFESVASAARDASTGMGNTWLIRRRLPIVGERHQDAGLQYGKLVAQLYRAAVDHTGADLLVDASKSPWHCAVAASLEAYDTTVLHLIRDPRGVAHSLRKKVEYQTAGEKIEMDRHGPLASSGAWVYRNRLVEAEWKGSHSYLQMRYEDFIADPQRHTQAIMDLVGLPDTSPAFVGSSEVDIAPSHNISGNPVRFRKGTVTLRADDKWRELLPVRIQTLVRVVTWPHMRHFGYR